MGEQLRQKEETRLITQKLKDDVTRKLQNQLTLFYSESKNRITFDLKDQTALATSEKKITVQLNQLEQMKDNLTRHCTHVEKQTQLIQSKLQEKKTNSNNNEQEKQQQHVDDLVQPTDLHSKQMLYLSAENAAISDCLYFLDKALSKGNVSLDLHLKKTRELAKRQFLVRAHCMKIAHFKSKMNIEKLNSSVGSSMVSM